MNGNKERKIQPVKTPVESVGSCKNASKCGNQYTAYLGNGYCITCWDKGLGGGIKIPTHIKNNRKNDYD